MKSISDRQRSNQRNSKRTSGKSRKHKSPSSASAPLAEHIGDNDLTAVHESPGHLIRRCHQIAVGLFLDTFGDYGITSPQLSILLIVKERPGVHQTQLSGLAALDRTNTATTLMRLEEKGLITRKTLEADKRNKHVYITAAGKRLLKSLPSEPDAVTERLLDELTPAEKHLFIDILKKIVNSKNAWSRAPLHQRLYERRQLARTKSARN